MNIFSLILYILIGAEFILALLAFTSTSHKQRQKFQIVFLVVGLTYIGILSVSIKIHEYPSPLVVFHLLAFGVIWPQLIARLIVQQRVTTSMVKSKINISNLVSGIAGIIFMAGMTLLIGQPHRISVIDGKPIYDDEDIRLLRSFLFATIPAIVLYFMVAIQRTEINKSGVLYNGLQWAWSDFQSFTWKAHPKDDLIVELSLKTKNRGSSNKLN